MNIKRSILTCATVALLFLMIDTAAPQETCCERAVATMPITMPGPQEADCSGSLNNAINEVLTANAAQMGDCPVTVAVMDFSGLGDLDRMTDRLGEMAGAPRETGNVAPGKLVDYLFKGKLSLLKIDDVDPGEWESGYEGQPNRVPGNVHGTWKLGLELVDSARGTVVRTGSTTWSGFCTRDANAAVISLINTRFMPLDDIIYDYERTPVSCSVDPEKDPVEPDEEMTVTVSGIKDTQGRNSADFQWILAEAEDGRILNGIEKGGFKGFQVDGGTVDLRYKAPSCCKKEDENVFIYNSCWEKPEHPGSPQNRIGKVTFTKQPKEINAFIEYDHELIQKFPCDGCFRRNRITGSVPITIEMDDKPPSIHGRGNVTSELYGEGDGCTLSASGMMNVSISGTMKDNGNDRQLLLVRFDEHHAEDWTVHMVCSRKPDDSGDYSEVMGPAPRSKDDVWTFDFEHDYRLHLQANFSGKGWNNILRVPCLASCSK